MTSKWKTVANQQESAHTDNYYLKLSSAGCRKNTFTDHFQKDVLKRLQFSLSLTLDMYGNQSGELAFETSGVKTKQNKTKQHSFTLFHWCKTLYGLANPSSTLHRQTTSLALQGVKQFGIVLFTSFVLLKAPHTLLLLSHFLRFL